LLRDTPANSYGQQRMSFPDGVTALFGISYQTLPGFRPLTLDLYQPRPRSSALPLVVFIHGGGFEGGDSRHGGSFEDFPRTLAGLAARGYVVAAVNYRLSGEAHFPAAVQDVKAAIRWLGSQAGAYNIDATRIAVWGAGSGGQLAALTGVTCGVGLFEPEAATSASSDCVQAVIDWSGISDLKGLAADNGAAAKDKPAGGFAPTPSSEGGEFLGCEPASCPPAVARLASPLGYIKATSPPFLIQHGAADAQVSPKQAQRLHDALIAAGAHAQLILYPGVGHEFRRDGAPDPAVNALAMEQVTDFLAATFPYAPLGSAPGAGISAPPMRRTVQN
jgi:acetyl esterase/lipase